MLVDFRGGRWQTAGMAKEEDNVWRVTTAKWKRASLGGLLGGR
jgi:hypothetical protein